ncbi:hypothetical protein [Paraburkholderia sp. GAS334]|uniref:hypothetical protein n=1 Tax=Paraburkholderia sp. GAS334 TaxID=3035131 RepID=UPI003D1FA6E2
MANNVHALPTHRTPDRRRARPLQNVPRADVMSLQKYRDEAAINSGLAAAKEMQRDSHVQLSVNAFGDITYDCHFNQINIERVMDVLVLLMIRARIVRTKGSADYRSE